MIRKHFSRAIHERIREIQSGDEFRHTNDNCFQILEEYGRENRVILHCFNRQSFREMVGKYKETLAQYEEAVSNNYC